MHTQDFIKTEVKYIDAHIGQRIAHLRKLRKLSQTTLGKMCGVGMQQMSKYEKGKSRITAGRLWLIALALNADLDSFYDDLGIIKAPDMG